MKLILLTLLFPILLTAQVDFIQNQYGLFAIGNNNKTGDFILCEVENEKEFTNYLKDKHKRYVAGAVVYEQKYNITIRVLPLHNETVLILYRGEQDTLNYSEKFTYFKTK